jgi:hypothetical protein
MSRFDLFLVVSHMYIKTGNMVYPTMVFVRSKPDRNIDDNTDVIRDFFSINKSKDRTDAVYKQTRRLSKFPDRLR